MQIKLSQIGLRLAASSAILAVTSGTLCAYEETAVQRNACKPDVYRFCKWYIPSRDGITYCLHQNIDKISPACRAVLEGKLR